MKEARGYRPADWTDTRVETRPSPIHGQGMYAAAAIQRGEVVTVWGGTLLLTEKDPGCALATIGEGLYLARPLGANREDRANLINHSCDPNVWLRDEVTLAARRDIAPGEELTLDYAMFESDEAWIARFACRCTSALCRGVLTGKDWRRDDLQARYCGGFSPFLCARMEKLRSRKEGGWSGDRDSHSDLDRGSTALLPLSYPRSSPKFVSSGARQQ